MLQWGRRDEREEPVMTRDLRMKKKKLGFLELAYCIWFNAIEGM